MRVIPEINIMNGHCVKQSKGSCHYLEIISHSPRKIAKMWEEQGASYLHIRDIDGLMTGNIINDEAIKKLVDCVSIPVEIYGGICSLKEVENMLNLGVNRIVLGLNYSSLHFVKEAAAYFGADRIAVNLKSIFGKNAGHPNGKISMTNMQDNLQKLISLGITRIEYENWMTDAYAFSSNLEYLSYIITETNLDFIVSGGVTTMKELESLHNIGVYGVILSSEIYEPRIELKYAIKLFDKGVNVNEL